MQFIEKEIKLKSYITTEVLFITKKVELINKKEFTAAILSKNVEMFVIYVATLLIALKMQVYFFYQV